MITLLIVGFAAAAIVAQRVTVRAKMNTPDEAISMEVACEKCPRLPCGLAGASQREGVHTMTSVR